MTPRQVQWSEPDRERQQKAYDEVERNPQQLMYANRDPQAHRDRIDAMVITHVGTLVEVAYRAPLVEVVDRNHPYRERVTERNTGQWIALVIRSSDGKFVEVDALKLSVPTLQERPVPMPIPAGPRP